MIFAITEKHTKGAVLRVGDDKVWVMIVIEVGDRNRSRTVAGRKNDAIEGGLERAAAAQKPASASCSSAPASCRSPCSAC